MASFLIPKTNIDKLNTIISDFWWGKVDGKKKMHWVSWEKLCLPKENGGLGFKDLEAFNHALLAKQTWRLIQNPDLLLAQIYKAKYFPKSTLMQAGKGSNPSWGWRGILKGREIIKLGHRWQVGDGITINPFLDHWVPTSPPSSPILEMKESIIDIPLSVAGFIDNGNWDQIKLNSLFRKDSVSLILSIPIPKRQTMDKMIWQLAGSGEYTVHSGYGVAKDIMAEEPQYEPIDVVDSKIWKEIWEIKIQPKFHFFLWRILRRSLPVRAELFYRGLDIPTLCPVCWEEEETIEHLFFECILTLKVAKECNLPVQEYKGPSFVYAWRKLAREDMSLRVSFILFWWRLWKSRNLVVFKLTQDSAEKISIQFFFMLKEQLENFSNIDPPQIVQVTNTAHINRPICKGVRSSNAIWVQVDGAINKNVGGAIGFSARLIDGFQIFAGVGISWE
ncbi:Uncharacterized mitochondrial protein AtMg00310 [Linum perenne]